ncbi:hypothetical protein PG984_006946 [Apiospora sp. TS-2023a]
MNSPGSSGTRKRYPNTRRAVSLAGIVVGLMVCPDPPIVARYRNHLQIAVQEHTRAHWIEPLEADEQNDDMFWNFLRLPATSADLMGNCKQLVRHLHARQELLVADLRNAVMAGHEPSREELALVHRVWRAWSPGVYRAALLVWTPVAAAPQVREFVVLHQIGEGVCVKGRQCSAALLFAGVTGSSDVLEAVAKETPKVWGARWAEWRGVSVAAGWEREKSPVLVEECLDRVVEVVEVDVCGISASSCLARVGWALTVDAEGVPTPPPLKRRDDVGPVDKAEHQ